MPPSLPFHRPPPSALGQLRCEHPISGAWGRFTGMVFHIRSGGDFGAEPPRSEGSGGKAFCSTKRFLWHKNTPCPALRAVCQKGSSTPCFQFGGKAMMTLQSACNKGCLNFFPRFPAVSLGMTILTNDLLFCRQNERIILRSIV